MRWERVSETREVVKEGEVGETRGGGWDKGRWVGQGDKDETGGGG